MFGRILLVTLLCVLFVNFSQFTGSQPVSVGNAISVVLQSRIYQLFILAAVVLNTRHILFRLKELDK